MTTQFPEVNNNEKNIKEEKKKVRKSGAPLWVTVLMAVLLYAVLIIGGCYLFMFLITLAIVANM